MTRSLLLAAILVLTCANLPASNPVNVRELLALQGTALFKAADQIAYDKARDLPPADLPAICQRLAAEGNNLANADDNRSVFTQVFKIACDKATGEELPQLIEIYAGFDANSFEKRYSLAGLAAAWIVHESEAVTAGPGLELPAPRSRFHRS